jgi:hypothetical protein
MLRAFEEAMKALIAWQQATRGLVRQNKRTSELEKTTENQNDELHTRHHGRFRCIAIQFGN